MAISVILVLGTFSILLCHPYNSTTVNDVVDGIHIYNEEVQQINITDRDTNPYIVYAEHGDVYTVENYSVFRQLVPGWHTVDVQVPVNPDKMPRIVGVRYP